MIKKELQLYAIMPLDTAHLDEICEDIRYQYEKGIATCPLFSMTLVPEGDPPVNKAEILCAKYSLFKQKLDALSIPSGVLVQASIGHGWVLSHKFPFQRYVGLLDDSNEYIVCPYDKDFQGYMYDALRTIALQSPKHIMIDDDLRLILRDGGGCICPLHLKRFNELAGTSFTAEQVQKIFSDKGELRDKYNDALVATQREAVLEAAKAMRAGIDSVDPSLPASFCCVGTNAEFAAEIAETLAGEGNPITVRINNGNYTPHGPRFFSKFFFKAAAQAAKLRGKADVILAETDTCPQNRYSTGAMSLHTHFTGTILEGAQGAKHWITRLLAHEPQSGMAYRRVLGKYSGFYRALAGIVPELSWRGCRAPVCAEPHILLGQMWAQEKDSAWVSCVLERLGLPVYFSAENGGVLCLEGEDDKKLDDNELKKALGGTVMLASDTALSLIKRGFGEYLGVDVREWRGKTATGERLHINGNETKRQMRLSQLIPTSENTFALSTVFHTLDRVNFEDLFPGVTEFKNSLGGRVFVFSGTPLAEYNIVEAFSFLTYSRKLQLIDILKRSGELPIYYPHDEEVYLRAADMTDGRLFCAVFNISTDPIDRLELVCEKQVSAVSMLDCDGNERQLDFSFKDGLLSLDIPCAILTPVILFIKTA